MADTEDLLREHVPVIGKCLDNRTKRRLVLARYEYLSNMDKSQLPTSEASYFRSTSTSRYSSIVAFGSLPFFKARVTLYINGESCPCTLDKT